MAGIMIKADGDVPAELDAHVGLPHDVGYDVAVHVLDRPLLEQIGEALVQLRQQIRRQRRVEQDLDAVIEARTTNPLFGRLDRQSWQSGVRCPLSREKYSG